MNELITKLQAGNTLAASEYIALLQNDAAEEALFAAARNTRERVFGKDVYMRGLIELTSYCKNDCFYCGIRCSNHAAERYRLSHEEVLECCAQGYQLGFRTFVLQGGEDPYYTQQRIVKMVQDIKAQYPDCAVTLSLGEWEDEAYHAFRQAGADRYLLRHETANELHYQTLHPEQMTLARRMHCLQTLKRLGFQTGCGMMVGSPGQTVEHLAEDLAFIASFRPQMIGIGPFVPHHATPFAAEPAGSVSVTLRLLAIVRLLLPHALLPATTALGTVDDNGRERGILAGANVVMPNLSPAAVRSKYLLYDNKIATGSEAAESIALLQKRMEAIGYTLVSSRGDYPEEC